MNWYLAWRFAAFAQQNRRTTTLAERIKFAAVRGDFTGASVLIIGPLITARD